MDLLKTMATRDLYHVSHWSDLINFLYIMALGTRFRESGNFSIPKVKSFGKKTFVYNGCILWNDLPSSIKEKLSIYDFKMTVKKHFLELLPE